MNESLMNIAMIIIGLLAIVACLWAFILEHKGKEKEKK